VNAELFEKKRGAAEEGLRCLIIINSQEKSGKAGRDQRLGKGLKAQTPFVKGGMEVHLALTPFDQIGGEFQFRGEGGELPSE